MNLQYLGDALDHWKGSIFEALQAGQVLRDFLVEPMATDHREWSTADWDLLARLLRIHPDQIVKHQTSFADDRARYFLEIPASADLFLDPDTGIRTGAVDAVAKYVEPRELHSLLNQYSERLLVVYQHVRAKKTRDRIEEVLTAVRRVDGAFDCVSYESGTVALLFMSKSTSRVSSVRRFFESYLGRHAEGRIGNWERKASSG